MAFVLAEILASCFANLNLAQREWMPDSRQKTTLNQLLRDISHLPNLHAPILQTIYSTNVENLVWGRFQHLPLTHFNMSVDLFDVVLKLSQFIVWSGNEIFTWCVLKGVTVSLFDTWAAIDISKHDINKNAIKSNWVFWFSWHRLVSFDMNILMSSVETLCQNMSGTESCRHEAVSQHSSNHFINEVVKDQGQQGGKDTDIKTMQNGL